MEGRKAGRKEREREGERERGGEREREIVKIFELTTLLLKRLLNCPTQNVSVPCALTELSTLTA